MTGMWRELAADDLLAMTAAYRQADPIGTNQIASVAVSHGTWLSGENRFWTAVDGGKVSGVAMYNAVRGVWIDPSVVSAHANDLGHELASSVDSVIPLAMGSHTAVQAFIDGYTRARPNNVKATWKKDVLLYVLEKPIDLDANRFRGDFRLANADKEQELLVGWLHAFEAYVNARPCDAPSFIEKGMKREALFLWEVDGVPVGFATYSPPVAIGNETIFRLGPIFVVEGERRKGYGSALTAALSRHLQQTCSTPSRVCLYTDANNPASNKAYLNAGFVLHSTACRYRFTVREP
ncbi:hypothetical protein LEN26_019012 [Aphanomyces euteiches]|nr:hypothetical protein LEN26_019012 [Aphanomyces euteiches]KAH9129765.1 hypothetical protein AeMF1_000185 [Aphanomyces euteiches]KAH9195224.1 hypothetical protein AeNC1_002805 [Aphanomyces euteiches]